MRLLPAVQARSLEELEPGELFLCFCPRDKFFALKLALTDNDQSHPFVVLGPVFPDPIVSPTILCWPTMTALSFGKDYCVQFSTDSSTWSSEQPRSHHPCLAIIADQAFIRVKLPFGYGFVELKTGNLVGGLSAGAVYTCDWEIVVAEDHPRPRPILKYSTV